MTKIIEHRKLYSLLGKTFPHRFVRSVSQRNEPIVRRALLLSKHNTGQAGLLIFIQTISSSRCDECYHIRTEIPADPNADGMKHPDESAVAWIPIG
jgi:hypothetical protein